MDHLLAGSSVRHVNSVTPATFTGSTAGASLRNKRTPTWAETWKAGGKKTRAYCYVDLSLPLAAAIDIETGEIVERKVDFCYKLWPTPKT